MLLDESILDLLAVIHNVWHVNLIEGGQAGTFSLRLLETSGNSLTHPVQRNTGLETLSCNNTWCLLGDNSCHIWGAWWCWSRLGPWGSGCGWSNRSWGYWSCSFYFRRLNWFRSSLRFRSCWCRRGTSCTWVNIDKRCANRNGITFLAVEFSNNTRELGHDVNCDLVGFYSCDDFVSLDSRTGSYDEFLNNTFGNWVTHCWYFLQFYKDTIVGWINKLTY